MGAIIRDGDDQDCKGLFMVEMEEGLVFARDIGAQWLILEDDSTVIIIVVQLDCTMGVALVTWYLRYSRVGVFFSGTFVSIMLDEGPTNLSIY